MWKFQVELNRNNSDQYVSVFPPLSLSTYVYESKFVGSALMVLTFSEGYAELEAANRFLLGTGISNNVTAVTIPLPKAISLFLLPIIAYSRTTALSLSLCDSMYLTTAYKQ